jgi:hypothetical protein
LIKDEEIVYWGHKFCANAERLYEGQ